MTHKPSWNRCKLECQFEESMRGCPSNGLNLSPAFKLLPTKKTGIWWTSIKKISANPRGTRIFWGLKGFCFIKAERLFLLPHPDRLCCMSSTIPNIEVTPASFGLTDASPIRSAGKAWRRMFANTWRLVMSSRGIKAMLILWLPTAALARSIAVMGGSIPWFHGWPTPISREDVKHGCGWPIIQICLFHLPYTFIFGEKDCRIVYGQYCSPPLNSQSYGKWYRFDFSE